MNSTTAPLVRQNV